MASTANPVHGIELTPTPTPTPTNNPNEIPPVPNSSSAFRMRCYMILTSVRFSAFMFLLVLFDIGVLLIEDANPIRKSQFTHTETTAFEFTQWTILLFFVLEIIVKLTILHPYLYIKDPFNIFDFFVVLISIIFKIIELWPGDSETIIFLR